MVGELSTSVVGNERCRQRPLAVVVLLLLTFAAFGRTLLTGEWISDDYPFIFNNPSVFAGMDIELRQLALAWWEPVASLYVPVACNAWWLISVPSRVLSDGNIHPFPFHLANLLVHWSNSLLVFAIVRRFVDARYALVAAAVFAVHPIQTEAVSWASMLKDLLAATMLFSSMLLYLQMHERTDTRACYLASLLLAWFATMSKPGAVVIGPCLLILEWLKGETSFRRAAIRVIPFFLLAIPAAIITLQVQPATEIWEPPILLRPWVAAYSVVHYLWTLIFPVGLTSDYGIKPLWIVVSDAGIIATLILAGLLAGILLLPRRHRKMTLACLLLMVIALAPVLGFKRFAYQLFSTVADHYFYMPMLAVVLLIGYALQAMGRRGLVVAMWLLVLVFAGASFVQTRYWMTNRAIVDRAIETTPGTLMYADESTSEQERYALAARLLLAYPEYQYGCKIMMQICLDRGDLDAALIYEQRLVDRSVTYLPEERDTAEQCAYFAMRLLDAGQIDKARRYASFASRHPNLTSVRQLSARLAELAED